MAADGRGEAEFLTRTRTMKTTTRALLSTISSAALTAALAGPAFPRPPVANETAPIARLEAIRKAYLASLPAEEVPTQTDAGPSDIAQFSNFSNWRNG